MSKKKLLFMPKLRFFNSKNNIIGKKKKLHVLQSIYGKTKGGLFCLFFFFIGEFSFIYNRSVYYS